MKKTALITGINGMDGSHLAELLISKGYTVYGTVRENSNLINLNKIKNEIQIRICDITNFNQVMDCITQINPDEIYNLAGRSEGGGGWNDLMNTMMVNGHAAVNLLSTAYNHNKNIKFFQASSSEMFNGFTDKTIITESESQYKPTSPYGVSKLYAHNTVKIFREHKNMFATAGILFTHESERRSLKFVARKITHGVAKIKMGITDRLTIGSLNAMRDWGYAPDYAECMWRMLQYHEPCDFIIATSQIRRISELCETAFQVVGINNWQDYISIDSRFNHNNSILIGDNSRAQQKLNWYPRTKFEDMIKTMVETDLSILH